jgi:hypothetical protein
MQSSAFVRVTTSAILVSRRGRTNPDRQELSEIYRHHAFSLKTEWNWPKLVNNFQRLQLTFAAQHPVCRITYIPATQNKKPRSRLWLDRSAKPGLK